MAPSDWKVKTLRYTAFISIGPRDSFPVPGRLWDALKLDQPEAMTHRANNVTAAIGLWNGARLTIKVEGLSQAVPVIHPNGEAEIALNQDQARIDLLWESVWLTHSGKELLPKFKELAKAIIGSSDFMPITRLAIGINGGHIVENRDEAYRHLSVLVPWVKTDPSIRELVIRFNRQTSVKTCKPRDLVINRMCQFVCALFERKGHHLEEQSTAACCDADVNTLPQAKGSEIDRDEAQWLVDSLSDIAEQCIVKGDQQ